MSPPEYELLPSDPEYELLPTGAAPDRPPAKRRRPLHWLAAGAGVTFVLLAVLGFAFVGPPPTIPRRLRPSWMPAPQPYTGKRVYLRVGALGADGFGSALQHFKQSVILSRALNSTLILASEQSEHRYSTSQIFNGLRDEASLDVHNACRMKDHLPQERRNDLVRGWCAGEAAALADIDRIQAEMAECTGIVDVDEREITEDLNGCIGAWIRERLAPATPPVLPPPLTLPPTRPVTVGVHIRWGDTGTPGSAPDHFRGSMNIPALVRVLADIRASPVGARGVELTIAMENAEPRVLAELGEANYTLVDSGDAIADMYALGAQDILLLGESSWAVMVHVVAPPGLTVVEFSGGNKYLNTTGFGRNVVMLHDYAPESLLQGPWGGWASS
ncbi:hypothetical protein FB451DRAFT_1360109 [Mycena latifolia]|nr:hypothetical protein FB451DRAFT_1360109 [Mycena latifolia]